VRIISVPRLSELSATNLIKEVAKDPVLKLYLPEIKEKRGLNRQFLFNVQQSSSDIHLLGHQHSEAYLLP
jgi:hypothetical protein